MTTKHYVQYDNGETYCVDDPSIFRNAKVLPRKEGERAYHEFKRKELLALINPGDTIYTVQTKDAVNGAASWHKLLIPAVSPEGRFYIRDITRDVAALQGHKLNKYEDSIVMSGTGYSRSFQLVYGLGLALWPTGTDKPHGVRNGEPDSNGGYALKQQGL
jgi:hypothetical protein